MEKAIRIRQYATTFFLMLKPIFAEVDSNRDLASIKFGNYEKD